MKPHSPTPLLFLISIFLIFSCKAKYDFNGRVALDGEVPNQVVSETLPCGTGKLEFDYTVVAEHELGILEIENRGSCDIDVELTRLVPEGTRVRDELPPDIKNFTIRKGDPPSINVFTIPAIGAEGKLHFKISCKQAEADAGCSFYYRFSTARNIKGEDPVTKDISLNETGLTVVPGGAAIGANQCVTPRGNEKILKKITNRTETEFYVTFDAVSECSCDYFIVYRDPENQKRNKTAKAPPANPRNNEHQGIIHIPKNTVITIKAKCERGSQTNDPCDGRIINYKLTTKDNIK